MNWLLPIVYHLERTEQRRRERERMGDYLKQFGPRGSKAYQREAKRISRARSRDKAWPQ